MNLTRSHVHALRHEQIGGAERNGVLVVDKVLRVRGGSRTEEGDSSVVRRERVHGRQRLRGGEDRGRDRHVGPSAAGSGGGSGGNKLLQAAGRLAGLRVDGVDTSDGENVTLLDRPGGIDLGAITQATRRISNLLDEADIISSAYTLEVSSPGLERNLRTPVHFASAIGREVKIKTRPSVEGERRVDGTLIAADETTCEVRFEDGSSRVLQLSDIERAKTHFVGDAAPKPGKGSRPGRPANKSSTTGKKASTSGKKASTTAKKPSKTQPSVEEG